MFKKGYKQSDDHKRKIRESHKAKGELHWSKRPEVKAKLIKTLRHDNWLGKKRPAMTGKNHWFYGKKRPEMTGKNNPNWRGGISKERDRIAHTLEYKLWRKAVFERDNYTCRFCGQRGGKLEADHIKPWFLYPELRFAIDNGRTLCKECHHKTDTWGWNGFYKMKNK